MCAVDVKLLSKENIDNQLRTLLTKFNESNLTINEQIKNKTVKKIRRGIYRFQAEQFNLTVQKEYIGGEENYRFYFHQQNRQCDDYQYKGKINIKIFSKIPGNFIPNDKINESTEYTESEKINESKKVIEREINVKINEQNGKLNFIIPNGYKFEVSFVSLQ